MVHDLVTLLIQIYVSWQLRMVIVMSWVLNLHAFAMLYSNE
jgi:hypothetical protein